MTSFNREDSLDLPVLTEAPEAPEPGRHKLYIGPDGALHSVDSAKKIMRQRMALGNYGDIIVVDGEGNGDYETLGAAIAALGTSHATILVVGKTTETGDISIPPINMSVSILGLNSVSRPYENPFAATYNLLTSSAPSVNLNGYSFTLDRGSNLNTIGNLNISGELTIGFAKSVFLNNVTITDGITTTNECYVSVSYLKTTELNFFGIGKKGVFSAYHSNFRKITYNSGKRLLLRHCDVMGGIEVVSPYDNVLSLYNCNIENNAGPGISITGSIPLATTEIANNFIKGSTFGISASTPWADAPLYMNAIVGGLDNVTPVAGTPAGSNFTF